MATPQNTLTPHTICAISTPNGTGGIAVARISGPQALTYTNKIWQGTDLTKAKTHTAHLGTIIDTQQQPLDQAIATIYRGPHSYTGEDTVEISVHGSIWIQRQLLNTLTAAGCKIARPGEFTQRAFTNQRLSLTQAEAVADIIAASSRAAHQIAIRHLRGQFAQRLQQLRQKLLNLASLLELELDFSEEDVQFASRTQLTQLTQQLHNELTRLTQSYQTGTAIKQGIPVAIIGPTNAGKSTLLNTLIGDQRAIVSDIHGTTRDIIEDTAEIGKYLFRFIDTAGLRHTTDTIEQLGIQRTHQAAQQARIILLVADATLPPDQQTIHTAQNASTNGAHIIFTPNKTDLPHADTAPYQTAADTINAGFAPISAATGQGIDQLRQQLINTIDKDTGADDSDLLVTNARHAQALQQAADSTARILDGLQTGISGDFIAQDLRQTMHHLSELSGEITTPDILQNIFTHFCIGK